MCLLRVAGGDCARAAAIHDGSRVSSLRNGPKSRFKRTYAKQSIELEVNGIGPFSLAGSRLDSGACCHIEVQDRKAHLEIQTNKGLVKTTYPRLGGSSRRCDSLKAGQFVLWEITRLATEVECKCSNDMNTLDQPM